MHIIQKYLKAERKIELFGNGCLRLSPQQAENTVVVLTATLTLHIQDVRCPEPYYVTVYGS